VIFIRYEATFDRTSAAALAAALAAMALALVAFDVWTRGRQRFDAVRGGARPAGRVALGRWRWPAIAFVVIVLGLALALPLGVLGYWFARAAAGGIGPSGIWSAALGSVLASGFAAALAAVAAVPVAFLGVRYRARLLTRLVEVLSYTGYALPGLVVALALVFASVRFAWLYQSHLLLVTAYALLFLPQAVNATRVALLQVRPSMEDAARGLGRRPREVLTSITLPLATRGVLAGAALVFLTTIKELPATLLLAPPGFQTLATRVWSTTADARYAEAAVPAIMLIAVSALALGLLQPAERR
jgi:iron(III) transport system permease protein